MGQLRFLPALYFVSPDVDTSHIQYSLDHPDYIGSGEERIYGADCPGFRITEGKYRDIGNIKTSSVGAIVKPLKFQWQILDYIWPKTVRATRGSG